MDNVVSAPQKSFLTTGEVAKLLGCSSYWVNILINRGELETHRIGNMGWHRVSVKDLQRYARKHEFKLDWSLLDGTRVPSHEMEGT